MSKKRRFINNLPIVNQTNVIKKFTSATADQLIQPEKTSKFSGFVGEKPFYYKPSDVYLKEPTRNRRDYQLSPSMTVINQLSGENEQSFVYEDLLNHLRFQGANVTTPNRLFSQEYYSWAPPIDIDMFINYNNYYWLPDGPVTIQISTSSTNPINILSDIIGKSQYTTPSGLTLYNGMKLVFTGSNIAPIDMVDITYIVDGVGKSIILTSENDMNISLEFDEDDADYIVMERGAKDLNPWSRRNHWYHKDAILILDENGNPLESTEYFGFDDDPFDSEPFDGTITTVADPINLSADRQAKRPIICFERDLELFNFGNTHVGKVNVLDTNTTDINTEIIGQASYIIDGVELSDGVTILITNEVSPSKNNKIYKVEFVAGVINLVPQELSENSTDPVIGNSVIISSGINNVGRSFYWNGEEWVESQRKTKNNQAPLFQLYDYNGNSLSDDIEYPGNTFIGNNIVSYSVNTTGTALVDTFLDIPLVYQSIETISEIQFDYNLVTDRVSYEIDGIDLEIEGNYFYRKLENNTPEYYSNGWHKKDEISSQKYIEQFIIENETSTLNLEVNPNLVIIKTENEEIKDFSLSGNQITLNEPVSNLVITVSSSVDSATVPTGTKGHFEIPLNLSNNPNNDEIETFTRSLILDHFTSIIRNQTNFIGSPSGNNNYRNTKQDLSKGNVILRHTAPLLKTMLFAANRDNMDIVKSIQYAQDEYIRFRNKLEKKSTELYKDTFTFSNPAWEWLDEIVRQINLSKRDNTFPFYYSQMFVYGKNYIDYTPTIIIGSSFVDSPISYDPSIENETRKLVIYKNNNLLLEGIDYQFDNTLNRIIFNDAFILNDTILVRVYDSISPSFCPSTAASMGICPIYKPEVYLDDTYYEPLNAIQCHDGSVHILYGDYVNQEFTDPRDYVIFEFEKRVYNTIPYKFRTNSDHHVNCNVYRPSAYRDSNDGLPNLGDYSQQEFENIILRYFQQWASKNSVAWRTNNTYDANNAWTWNYSSVAPENIASWRGIYLYLFDTVRPHSHPWEMLGFAIKPSWWENEYGAAPYTRGNTILWDDIRDGIIKSGDRAGIDHAYIRPNLYDILPVDNAGNLLNPIAANICNTPQEIERNTDWNVGDVSPAEYAWMRSPEFSFSWEIIKYLMKPAITVENEWDSYNLIESPIDSDIILNQLTSLPVKNSNIIMHSENDIIRYGIQQWIADYIISQGKNVTDIAADDIRGLDVRLSYRHASFVVPELMKFTAESVSPTSTTGNIQTLVNGQDVNTILYKSASKLELFYSGVIIEWSGTSYRVYGYDLNNPTFNVIPVDTNGQKSTITVADLRLTKYRKFKKSQVTYPYGYEFTSRQDVVDFLLGYEEYLKSIGFVFETLSDVSGEINDWTYAIKEFMFWSQQNWTAGNFITVSPAADNVVFNSKHGVVENLETIIQGSYAIVDRAGASISPRYTDITRDENTLEIKPNNNQGIYGLRIYLIEYEHVSIIRNTTRFQDVIYNPLYGIRRPRLKLQGVRVDDWTGRLEAAGYLVGTDGEMIPNFEKSVADIAKYYDIDTPVTSVNFLNASRKMIGFQEKDYLSSLEIDSDNQVLFYQGTLQGKGTKQPIDALFRSEIVNLNQENIDIREEWAIRRSEYGSTDAVTSREITLSDSDHKENRQTIRFSDGNKSDSKSDTVIDILPNDVRWINKPAGNVNFKERLLGQVYKNDLPNAGYPTMSEVNYTLFDIRNLDDIEINQDELLWVAKDVDISRKWKSGWNIRKAYNIGVSGIVQDDDTIVTKGYHGLSKGDLIALKSGSNTTYKAVSSVFTENNESDPIVFNYNDVDEEITALELDAKYRTEVERVFIDVIEDFDKDPISDAFIEIYDSNNVLGKRYVHNLTEGSLNQEIGVTFDQNSNIIVRFSPQYTARQNTVATYNGAPSLRTFDLPAAFVSLTDTPVRVVIDHENGESEELVEGVHFVVDVEQNKIILIADADPTRTEDTLKLTRMYADINKFDLPVRVDPSRTRIAMFDKSINTKTVSYDLTYTQIDDSTDTIMVNSHEFENGYKVVFTSAVDLPEGISLNTDYWIVNSTTNTFQLSSTDPDSLTTLVDITSQGSTTGTFRISINMNADLWIGNKKINIDLSDLETTVSNINTSSLYGVNSEIYNNTNNGGRCLRIRIQYRKENTITIDTRASSSAYELLKICQLQDVLPILTIFRHTSSLSEVYLPQSEYFEIDGKELAFISDNIVNTISDMQTQLDNAFGINEYYCELDNNPLNSIDQYRIKIIHNRQESFHYVSRGTAGSLYINGNSDVNTAVSKVEALRLENGSFYHIPVVTGNDITIDTVDINFTTDTFTFNNHGYQDDDIIVITGADVPEPLVSGNTYYIVQSTTNTFKVSATSGGAEIDLTDSGTGTIDIIQTVSLANLVEGYNNSVLDRALVAGDLVMLSNQLDPSENSIYRINLNTSPTDLIISEEYPERGYIIEKQSGTIIEYKITAGIKGLFQPMPSIREYFVSYENSIEFISFNQDLPFDALYNVYLSDEDIRNLEDDVIQAFTKVPTEQETITLKLDTNEDINDAGTSGIAEVKIYYRTPNSFTVSSVDEYFNGEDSTGTSNLSQDTAYDILALRSIRFSDVVERDITSTFSRSNPVVNVGDVINLGFGNIKFDTTSFNLSGSIAKEGDLRLGDVTRFNNQEILLNRIQFNAQTSINIPNLINSWVQNKYTFDINTTTTTETVELELEALSTYPIANTASLIPDTLVTDVFYISGYTYNIDGMTWDDIVTQINLLNGWNAGFVVDGSNSYLRINANNAAQPKELLLQGTTVVALPTNNIITSTGQTLEINVNGSTNTVTITSGITLQDVVDDINTAAIVSSFGSTLTAVAFDTGSGYILQLVLSNVSQLDENDFIEIVTPTQPSPINTEVGLPIVDITIQGIDKIIIEEPNRIGFGNNYYDFTSDSVARIIKDNSTSIIDTFVDENNILYLKHIGNRVEIANSSTNDISIVDLGFTPGLEYDIVTIDMLAETVIERSTIGSPETIIDEISNVNVVNDILTFTWEGSELLISNSNTDASGSLNWANKIGINNGTYNQVIKETILSKLTDSISKPVTSDSTYFYVSNHTFTQDNPIVFTNDILTINKNNVYYVDKPTAGKFELVDYVKSFRPSNVNISTNVFAPEPIDQAHGFINDRKVRININDESSVVPAGLVNDSEYYIINRNDFTFQLSLTMGGEPIDITDNGTGTFTIRQIFDNPGIINLSSGINVKPEAAKYLEVYLVNDITSPNYNKIGINNISGKEIVPTGSAVERMGMNTVSSSRPNRGWTKFETVFIDDGRTKFDRAFFEWRPNTAYVANELVNYEGAIYSARFDFTSSSSFQDDLDLNRFASSEEKNKTWSIYEYRSVTGNLDPENDIWIINRQEQPKVDSELITNAIIYDMISNRTTTKMSVFDPYKGLIPGIAEKELYYKTDFDPAKYTNTLADVAPIFNTNISWGKEQVGRLWWDLSKVSYLDYEQGNLEYRHSNWGKMFPGSSIVIYEWVESTVPPSEWKSHIDNKRKNKEMFIDGEVKDGDNASWSTKSYFDAKTQQTKTYYYFWVENPITFNQSDDRSIPANEVKRLIDNPTSYGLQWMSPIDTNIMIVNNIGNILNDQTVLQIDDSINRNMTNKHTEWDLIREEETIINDRHWNKLRDSLCGFDDLGLTVPDLSLNESLRYGHNIRPRQSWFKDKIEARKNFISKTNELLNKRIIVGVDSSQTWLPYFNKIDDPVIENNIITSSIPYGSAEYGSTIEINNHSVVFSSGFTGGIMAYQPQTSDDIVVDTGDYIFINGIRIDFPLTDLTSVVSSINLKTSITGVTVTLSRTSTNILVLNFTQIQPSISIEKSEFGDVPNILGFEEGQYNQINVTGVIPNPTGIQNGDRIILNDIEIIFDEIEFPNLNAGGQLGAEAISNNINSEIYRFILSNYGLSNSSVEYPLYSSVIESGGDYYIRINYDGIKLSGAALNKLGISQNNFNVTFDDSILYDPADEFDIAVVDINALTGRITITGHPLSTGDRVYIDGIADEFLPDTLYRVTKVDNDTIELTLTSSSPVIDNLTNVVLGSITKRNGNVLESTSPHGLSIGDFVYFNQNSIINDFNGNPVPYAFVQNIPTATTFTVTQDVNSIYTFQNTTNFAMGISPSTILSMGTTTYIGTSDIYNSVNNINDSTDDTINSYINQDGFLIIETTDGSDISLVNVSGGTALSSLGFDVGSYDGNKPKYTISTEAELQFILNPSINDLAYVEMSNEVNGGWCIYKWNGNEWIIFYNQTVNTSLYWNYKNWYETGYSDNTIIDFTANDIVEFNANTYPVGAIVRVNDDGQGLWRLFVINDEGPVLIGYQNSTIELKSTLYDYNISKKGFDANSFDTNLFDDTPNTEMRNILDGLKFNILTNNEINELFFFMIQYVLAEQNNVNWLFKTSYIHLANLINFASKEPLFKGDVNDLIIQHINEVKPYHVKIRDAVRITRIDMDQANINATDFDNSIYNDNGVNRVLNLESNEDRSIISSTNRQYWYNNYLEPVSVENENDYSSHNNRVRRLKIDLLFDRVEPYNEGQSLDGAAQRIADYHDVSSGVSKEDAMNTGFRGITYYGGEMGIGAGFDRSPFDLLGWDADEETILSYYDELISGGEIPVNLVSYNGQISHIASKEQTIFKTPRSVILNDISSPLSVNINGKFLLENEDFIIIENREEIEIIKTTITSFRPQQTLSDTMISSLASDQYIMIDGIKVVFNMGQNYVLDDGNPLSNTSVVGVLNNAFEANINENDIPNNDGSGPSGSRRYALSGGGDMEAIARRIGGLYYLQIIKRKYVENEIVSPDQTNHMVISEPFETSLLSLLGVSPLLYSTPVIGEKITIQGTLQNNLSGPSGMMPPYVVSVNGIRKVSSDFDPTSFDYQVSGNNIIFETGKEPILGDTVTIQTEETMVLPNATGSNIDIYGGHFQQPEMEGYAQERGPVHTSDVRITTVQTLSPSHVITLDVAETDPNAELGLTGDIVVTVYNRDTDVTNNITITLTATYSINDIINDVNSVLGLSSVTVN